MIEASRPQGGPQIRLAEPPDSDALSENGREIRWVVELGADR